MKTNIPEDFARISCELLQKIASDENLLKRLLDDDIHPGGAGHLEMAKEIFRTFGIYDADSKCVNPTGITHFS